MSRLFLMLAAGLMCFTARAEAANPDSFNVCLKKLYFKSDKVDYYKFATWCYLTRKKKAKT